MKRAAGSVDAAAQGSVPPKRNLEAADTSIRAFPRRREEFQSVLTGVDQWRALESLLAGKRSDEKHVITIPRKRHRRFRASYCTTMTRTRYRHLFASAF